jgi:hypothetical protein
VGLSVGEGEGLGVQVSVGVRVRLGAGVTLKVGARLAVALEVRLKVGVKVAEGVGLGVALGGGGVTASVRFRGTVVKVADWAMAITLCSAARCDGMLVGSCTRVGRGGSSFWHAVKNIKANPRAVNIRCMGRSFLTKWLL